MAERDWIKRYFAPLASTAGAAGLRDDVAQLAGDSKHIITTDALVETVHFLASDPIETIARKLVRVNVSDILSKGARPSQALLTLGWPDARPEQELALFANAFGDELSAWKTNLIGGDTVRSPSGLFLSLTLTGTCIGDGPVRRSTASAGDTLWVTGTIGQGGLGLAAALAEDDSSPHLAHYRTPHLPEIAITEAIAGFATASMDVSDGLLGDVLGLAEASQLGAEIALETVPFAVKTSDLAAMMEAAIAGDDYQILFAAAPKDRKALREFSERTGIKITEIGCLNAELGLKVTKNGTRVNLPETLGFEHG
jgi:thiamine-monophosphate kinase